MNRRLQWDVAIWGTWPPPYGGMATHIVRLLPRLDKEGIRTRVFNRASDGQDPPQAVSVRKRQLRWFAWFALFAPERVLYVFTGRPLVRFLAWVLKKLRGKRYILRAGEESLLRTLAGRRSLGRWMTMVALRGAEHIVAVSPHLAEPIIRAGIPPDRVHVIPGFIPPPDLSEQPPDYVVEFAKRHQPVLSANGQVWIKDGQDAYGLDLLVEAFQYLRSNYPDIGLLLSLYSGGPGVPGLDKLGGELARRGLEDMVLIRHEPHVFWPILKVSDVFVRPTRTEGDSGSIREAIHLGVPVVASDTTPRPAPSVLFENGNPNALIAGLERVLGDFETYKRTFAEAKVEDNALPIILLLKDTLRCAGVKVP